LVESTRTWLGTVEATTKTIEAAVTDNQGAIAAVRIKADEIRAGLTDAEKNLAAVSLTAAQLQTAMTTANGEISTIRQDATQISSTVSNLSGSISAIQQDVNGISQTVTGAGGLASQIQQLSDRVAIKLQSTVGGSLYTMEYGQGQYAGTASLNFYTGTVVDGHIVPKDEFGYFKFVGVGPTFVGGMGGAVGIAFEDNPNLPGDTLIIMGSTIAPDINSSGLCSVGTRGSLGERRFKNVNITGSVDTSSDLRLKTDVAPLDMAELLERLRPIRYRMIADGENGKVRWGFGAQHVREALGALGVQDVEFLDQENPEHLALCYQELIAVLVEGYQKLSARVAQLEKMLAKGGA
ncbi:MAG: tail fiber domain-containing protein, partial [Clostridia bacterium]